MATQDLESSDPTETREREERLQRILDANPEEIIIGDRLAANEGTEEDTGDHIWHMEDGISTCLQRICTTTCAETRARRT